MSVVHKHFYQTSEWIALCCVGTAVTLEYFIPLPKMPLWHLPDVGIVLILASVGILYWCKHLFQRSGQSTKPYRSTKKLITWGPYRYSRNPIYVAVVMLILGIGLIGGWLWVSWSSVVTASFIHKLLILPEEEYLEKVFNGEYVEYKKNVKCWI